MKYVFKLALLCAFKKIHPVIGVIFLTTSYSFLFTEIYKRFLFLEIGM